MILKLIKKLWESLNYISPNNRNMIIILLMGYIFYSLINSSTLNFLTERIKQELIQEKKAEQYTKDTAVEINRLVRLIADKDLEAYDVLLLSYHNNTQSLLGYKYLYLSCLSEAPRSLDTPLLKQQWNNIDYVYYADELIKIHNQSCVFVKNIELIGETLPKIYHLIKSSDAKAAIFYAIEGLYEPVGMIVILYKECPTKVINLKKLLPNILKLALLLDYNNLHKK